MPDRRLAPSRLTTATQRRIVALALARTDKYAPRAIAAPDVIAAAPDERPSRQPDI
jgi:hypothetical protein